MNESNAKSDVEGLPQVVVDSKPASGNPWRVGGTILTIAVVALAAYSRFRRAEERMDKNRREHQQQVQQHREQQQQGIREVEELIRRDDEAGGNSGPAIRKLLGQPAPRSTKE